MRGRVLRGVKKGYLSRMKAKMRGMRIWVAPPPRLPHPAAIPLAVPTMRVLNMELTQYSHETNVAREKPMKNRLTRNPPASSTSAIANTAGAMIMIRNADP
jgi:hypothetical protein